MNKEGRDFVLRTMRKASLAKRPYKEVVTEEMIKYAKDNHMTVAEVNEMVQQAYREQAANARAVRVAKRAERAKLAAIEAEKPVTVAKAEKSKVVRLVADQEKAYKGLFKVFNYIPYDAVVTALMPVETTMLVQWRKELMDEGYEFHPTSSCLAITKRPVTVENLTQNFKDAYKAGDVNKMGECLMGLIEEMGKISNK